LGITLDLINDVNIWGNLENFKGTVDPKNPFLANLLEKMDYLMKLLMEVGMKTACLSSGMTSTNNSQIACHFMEKQGNTMKDTVFFHSDEL